MVNITPKSTVKRSIRIAFIAYANIALFIGMAFFGMMAVLGTLGSGQGASDAVKLMIGLGILVVCGLFVLLGVYILKMTPPISFYDDGFVVGKDGDKVPYQGLQYHFVAGSALNKFVSIFYKSGDKFQKILALNYPSKGFQSFQDDVVNANLPQVVQKIEKGEKVVFRAKKPKAFDMRALKKLGKQFDEGIKVAISKDSIAFDDEVYSWSDYIVLSEYAGLIVVLDRSTNKKVLTFAQTYMIEQPNVVTALINMLGGR